MNPYISQMVNDQRIAETMTRAAANRRYAVAARAARRLQHRRLAGWFTKAS